MLLHPFLLSMLLLAAIVGTHADACPAPNGTVHFYNMTWVLQPNVSAATYYETVQLTAALEAVANRDAPALFVLTEPADAEWWPYVTTEVRRKEEERRRVRWNFLLECGRYEEEREPGWSRVDLSPRETTIAGVPKRVSFFSCYFVKKWAWNERLPGRGTGGSREFFSFLLLESRVCLSPYLFLFIIVSSLWYLPYVLLPRSCLLPNLDPSHPEKGAETNRKSVESSAILTGTTIHTVSHSRTFGITLTRTLSHTLSH